MAKNEKGAHGFLHGKAKHYPNHNDDEGKTKKSTAILTYIKCVAILPLGLVTHLRMNLKTGGSLELADRPEPQVSDGAGVLRCRRGCGCPCS